MDAAINAGARGGTILRGKGNSIYERYSFWGIEIEPEKDMVLIIVPSGIKKAVLSAINEEIHLKNPNSGIAFTLPVSDVIGLREDNEESS
jgi:nitrogen regulatory protein PII